MFYDYACRKCEKRLDDGKSDVILETVRCSAEEITSRPYPTCRRCGETMGRVYNQRVFDTYLQNKGIFPMNVNNLTAGTVRVESRDDLREKEKLYGRVQTDFSEGARYRHKQAKESARRIFSLRPS